MITQLLEVNIFQLIHLVIVHSVLVSVHENEVKREPQLFSTYLLVSSRFVQLICCSFRRMEGGDFGWRDGELLFHLATSPSTQPL